jgi:hypothetical protein
MPRLEWYEAVHELTKHVAKVSTPRGHGTGFLFFYAANRSICALATANHVVEEAATWEEPLRLEQLDTGKTMFLRPAERARLRRSGEDTAAILFATQPGMFPNSPLNLMPEKKAARIGVEIGWLGFPSVAPDNLCFFLGRISSRLESERSYLVDGVAINGVSGGPAFMLPSDGSITLLGIVSAYRPNLSERGALPGLCVVRHVGGLHQFVKQFKTLDEAKEQEGKSAAAPPQSPPPPPASPEGA